MMHKTLKLTLVTAAVCGAGLTLPGEAQAKKPGVLEGKPIVVDRIELRKLRFQITPQVGMSLSQPFVHKGFAGGKVRFDITDWIGIRAMFGYGVLDLDSKLTRAIDDGALPAGQSCTERGLTPAECPSSDPGVPLRGATELDNPAPLLHDFKAGLTKLQYHGSVDVAFTPFAGKLGLFSAIFTEYDIYIFGGFGYGSFARRFPDSRSTSDLLGVVNSDSPFLDNGDPDPQYCINPVTSGADNECILHPVKPDEGFRAGGSFGGGIHLFLNDWLSINGEVQDIMLGHNDAGLNATITDVPPEVDNSAKSRGGDRILRHNVVFNLGVTFYMAPKAKRSKLKR
jgi:outer membrane beta-barrel protein